MAHMQFVPGSHGEAQRGVQPPPPHTEERPATLRDEAISLMEASDILLRLTSPRPSHRAPQY